MKKNLVIEKSFKYQVRSSLIDVPENYSYQEDFGYWIDEITKTPMMFDSNGPKPRTKKEDIETGEDRKGE